MNGEEDHRWRNPLHENCKGFKVLGFWLLRVFPGGLRCKGGVKPHAVRCRGAGEYIKDTEEYINIELDSSRNRLIRLEIIITSATFGVAMFSLVAGARRPPGTGHARPTCPHLLQHAPAGSCGDQSEFDVYPRNTGYQPLWLRV